MPKLPRLVVLCRHFELLHAEDREDEHCEKPMRARGMSARHQTLSLKLA